MSFGSSAIPTTRRCELVGRLVEAVTNFPPETVAGVVLLEHDGQATPGPVRLQGSVEGGPTNVNSHRR
jgi:hypothetical protein